jgi:hypothetical protein
MKAMGQKDVKTATMYRHLEALRHTRKTTTR